MSSSAASPDNRISLHKLEVFSRVVERGSVRLAAEELYVSQPVISAHLRSLEERLGVRLFRRDGRGMELTQAGTEVHGWAVEVLRGRVELDRSLREIARGVAERASIGSSISAGSYLLPPILVELSRKHPHASVSLHQADVETALKRVVAGEFDFAVVATDAVLDTNSLDAELIGRPPFCLVAAVDDDRVGDVASVAELPHLPFICPPTGSAVRRGQDGSLGELGVLDRTVVIEMCGAVSIKVAVRGGLGVALLWREEVRDELDAGLVREVQFAGCDLRDKLYLVQRRGKRLTEFQSTVAVEICAGIRERLTRLS